MRNGRARASPESAPPSGGPPSRTAASRPVWAAAAARSWRAGTHSAQGAGVGGREGGEVTDIVAPDAWAKEAHLLQMPPA
jgi:hypothetical protein